MPFSGYAIYIHGLGSGAKSATKSSLAHYLPEYEWLAPEVNEDPYESMAIVDEYVKVFNPAIVAGTSLGGFYTAFCDAPSAVKIVCNAAIGIEKVLRRLGYGVKEFTCDREDGRITYTIDERMVRRFIEFRETHAITAGAYGLAVYSVDDELVGHVESLSNVKILETCGYDVHWSDRFGHRMNEKIAKKIAEWVKEIII